MNTTKKQNPHAWFFKYVTGLDGYNKDFEKEIREGIIFDFTNGLTGSLTELYTQHPELYRKMKAELLQPKTQPKTDEMDKARKRLIAAIDAYLRELKQQEPNIALIKSIACRASQNKDFNHIPLERLRSLYNAFVQRTKDMKTVDKLTLELLMQPRTTMGEA